MQEPRRLEKPWVWLLVIVLVTFGLYTPSFWDGYTYDDNVYVKVPSADGQPNQMVGELKPVAEYWSSWYGEGMGKFGRGYRPMTVLSYALVQRGFRVEDPAVTTGYSCSAAYHHIVNVLLHCLALVPSTGSWSCSLGRASRHWSRARCSACMPCAAIR